MARAVVDGAVLEYETLGDPRGPAVVITVGLGAQLVQCTDEFCRPFVERGFHVVRYDNRDAGLSSDHEGERYGLAEMAGDTIGLLDVLGIGQAHLVGASMGGMIAQEVAIRAPERVLSLCSALATTGASGVGGSTAETRRVLAERIPGDQCAAVDHALRVWRVTGSRRFPDEEHHVREVIETSVRRAFRPAGYTRQLRALRDATDRTEQLRGIRVPTLVIHGDADPVIDVSGGRATAEAVPGARWLHVTGMGHDVPRALWPTVTAEILDNAGRAG
ncbi:alpha/beta fold hydrolase [Pseudonocardia sp. TRM90224]|uniref:alpha/beta fold hydrolase n=1 Tax=Pseudonocardia sp. TRM90224 TaxID=2812678 RepID=UPI001E5A934B|nr:alpha/beta fold hydrolase [Pseudonocardia sp. TRM90224]